MCKENYKSTITSECVCMEYSSTMATSNSSDSQDEICINDIQYLFRRANADQVHEYELTGFVFFWMAIPHIICIPQSWHNVWINC